MAARPDFETIIKDPARIFSSPLDVARDGDLSEEEKIQILHAWDFDAHEIDDAGPEVLRQIREAMRQVGMQSSN
jgi:hypothetical protein